MSDKPDFLPDAPIGKQAWDQPRFKAWEKPTFQRIAANEAETGINFGPEILILVS